LDGNRRLSQESGNGASLILAVQPGSKSTLLNKGESALGDSFHGGPSFGVGHGMPGANSSQGIGPFAITHGMVIGYVEIAGWNSGRLGRFGRKLAYFRAWIVTGWFYGSYQF